MAYVSEYGNYGREGLLVFEDNLLTERQWNILDTQVDRDKMSYVQAIINGEDLDYWEEGYDA